ncbi:MAG: hypothetical protein ACFFC7_35050 [Candidatus Hermodarchaeota archaeon]
MVNWLLFVSDVIFMVVAAIICSLGLSTVRAIKHIGIGKSFWIPVSASGVLFLIGSIVRIFNLVTVELYSLTFFAVELGSLTIKTEEIVHISWLLALFILMFSIYKYSKKVKTMISLPTPDEGNELTDQATELLQQIKKLKKELKG